MDLLEYIAALAPEGETALIVQQKPIMRKGEAQRHADGTIKYTWPAFLPGHHRRASEAWYINTGSFILDRFTDGRTSASSANAQFTLFLMLDDIGTKSKEPQLPPTWIVETSPGNFQWCYAYREGEQPTLGEQQAALVALADAGYTDPGATNAVRNCRLPGSVNLKPQHNGFAARRVSFNPEREYSLAEICAAHGVTPAPADSGQRLQFRLRDTGADTVLAWMNEHGLVRSAANAEGWLGIVCPNHAEHSDGNVEARYKPLDRSFCCYHGHCQDLDSRGFLKWVADNGGPTVTPGLRDELLAQHMASAMGRLKPTLAYPNEAQAVVEQVERKEAGRVQKRDWYKRYAYVVADDSYFDLEYRTEYPRGAFNAIYRHVECKSIHGGRKIEASVCYDETRQENGAPILKGLIYAPGEGVLVSREGDVFGNRWVDARPHVDNHKGRDVSMWLDHCRTLVPNELELAHCLDVMAFKLKNPKVKINHAVLHGGVEGCGKDTMWAPYIWSVCGPALKNRGFLDNDTMSSQWGYHLESEILLLNELKEPEAVQRRALANRLKPVIAAPPETLLVNRKGKHPYETLNRLAVLAFTNDPVPISLPSQDRRWFCVWSDTGRMSEVEAARLWKWYENGGYEAVAAWLLARDVSKFNPAAAPPLTEWKLNMIEDGMSMSEGFLVEMIRQRRGEFAVGVVAAPLHGLVDRLQGSAPDGKKLHLQALLHALIEAGWKDRGRTKSSRNTTPKRVFCAPDMMRMSNSELRDLAEAPPEPNKVNLTVVK
jgi:hypothetical protein